MRTGKDKNTVRTTCPYCGVGCGILAAANDDGGISIEGDPAHPANFGRLCSKGSALGETLDHSGRLLHPEIGGRRAGWDEALDLIASRFSDAIAAFGPDSVAFYVSGQLLTEDYYVANKLMKGYIGSANIDTNSRLCMASSVAGHRRAFGTDTVPGTYADLELADLVVLVGSNLAWCHPVLYQRLAAAKAARPEMKVVLVDPRRTMTSDLADIHLPIRFDGDVALFEGLLAFLHERDGLNPEYINAHTSGFETALAAASRRSIKDISTETGLGIALLEEFYRLYLTTEKTVTVYSQGVNQSKSGTDKVGAIINCHLATGRIGREGMGPFSVTGQPNAMGGREVGGMANMLACHMDIENPDHRSVVQRFWNSPAIVTRPGLKAVDLFKAMQQGDIKAVWIMGTNPVDSLPEANLVREALETCPFVVVSDIMKKTDTTCHANVLLPSEGWGEKEGLVTNSERRISRQQKFLPSPGEARADWWQIAEVARRMGYFTAFDFPDAASVAREYAAMSAFENDGSRDFDIGALSHMSEEDFANFSPVQWPIRERTDPYNIRFFANGDFFTPDRKARFQVSAERGKQQQDTAGCFTLTTGRIRDHWHTMTRTGKSPRLSQHLSEPFVEIHPADAAELGIGDADLVQLYNGLGSVVVRALVTDRISRKALFLPMHWTDQFASNARANILVPTLTDPHSGQPASKNIPCSVKRFPVSHYGFALTREKPDLSKFDYWAISKCDGGWRIELAIEDPAADFANLAREILRDGEFLDYHDRSRNEFRLAIFDGNTTKGILYLSREPVPVSRSWLIGQFNTITQSKINRYELLAGRPGEGGQDIGAIVCSCFSVGRNQIVAAISQKGCASLAAVGQCVRAGTNCGSCR
ncbi:MAG: nitrate reductase, partial [Alphaproteobacteria bacterium]